MGTEHKKAEDYRIVILNWRLQFQDRPPDDPLVGPARMVDIAGRSTDCWGQAVALVDGNGRWIRIECQICGRRVDAEDAERERKRMTREAERNMPRVRVGCGAEYDENARFVLKILPDMDRNKAEFEKRVDDAKRKAQPKRKGRKLTRRRFSEKGTPGYLYFQACALVSGLGALPREMSAISVPLKPSSRGQMMERMGTAIIAGLTAAFACEVGMKAILMTRLDEANMTHDLLELYESLPEDCRDRLQGDFAGIADILRKYRDAFGKWRYFEPSTAQDAILALVDMDRIWGLERAARVIVDECVVAGLQYDINLQYHDDLQGKANVSEDLTFTIAPDDVTASTKVSIEIGGHESRIPWDAILSL